MKKNKMQFALAALTSLCLLGGIARANEGKNWDPDKKVQKMSRDLNLTSDQQNQIRQILTDAKSQGKTQAEYDDQVMNVLNDDQKAKYQKMNNKKSKKATERYGAPQGQQSQDQQNPGGMNMGQDQNPQNQNKTQ